MFTTGDVKALLGLGYASQMSAAFGGADVLTLLSVTWHDDLILATPDEGELGGYTFGIVRRLRWQRMRRG